MCGYGWCVQAEKRGIWVSKEDCMVNLGVGSKRLDTVATVLAATGLIYPDPEWYCFMGETHL